MSIDNHEQCVQIYEFIKSYLPSILDDAANLESVLNESLKNKFEQEFLELETLEIDLYIKLMRHYLWYDRFLLNFVQYEDDNFFEIQCLMGRNQNIEFELVPELTNSKMKYKYMTIMMQKRLWETSRCIIKNTEDFIFQMNIFFDQTHYESHVIDFEHDNQVFIEIGNISLQNCGSDLPVFLEYIQNSSHDPQECYVILEIFEKCDVISFSFKNEIDVNVEKMLFKRNHLKKPLVFLDYFTMSFFVQSHDLVKKCNLRTLRQIFRENKKIPKYIFIVMVPMSFDI